MSKSIFFYLSFKTRRYASNALNESAVLYHVKKCTFSVTLSHLFNQGLNSIRLIRDETEAFDNLLNQLKKINHGKKTKDFCKPLIIKIQGGVSNN